MPLKKIIIYPDNTLCIEGKLFSAPEDFFEKYGIAVTRNKPAGTRTKGADVIRRDNLLFVCHYQPQPKGPRNNIAHRSQMMSGLLPQALF